MADITLRDVRYAYMDAKGCTPVLDGLSLSIPGGSFVSLVGASGCGKTTLLRLLAGLLLPQAGEVRIGGKSVAGPCEGCAVVFQDYALFPWMTARKNVEFFIRHSGTRMGRAEIRDTAEAYLAKVDMLHAADKLPFQLSGGMRQRVALARALAMRADLLLLDEPFGALDAKTRSELQRLLEKLWMEEGNKTVVFVTHDSYEAVLLADRLLFMHGGRIEADVEVPQGRPRTELGTAEANKLCAVHRALRRRLYREEAGWDMYEASRACC